MIVYILKRLLLLIPTLLGIITLNFLLIQLSPGGPVDRAIAKLEQSGSHAEAQIAHNSLYKGSVGLDEKLIEEIKRQYGFDKNLAERYVLMLKNYASFELGKSFYRDKSVVDIILEKLPVSISLGVFSTLLIYLISIPLGIKKALKNGSKFDIYTSFFVVISNAIPAFMFGIFFIVLFAGGSYFDIFPLRGLTSENFAELSIFGKVADYLWHIFLPTLCLSLGGLATLSMLSKNCFLEEMNKAYVLSAYAKGAGQNRVLYGHIFRNAMLLIISSFPAVFVGMFFGASLLVEVLFSLDGLGLLGYESVIERDYPVVFGTLYIFTFFALVVGIISDITYTLVDPRINFDAR